ncbi:Ig domain-containing protein [Hyalangium minutum]|uniref:Uncharacterized protein n=1 Tax=Hyalangium minutum TaxID=394096 RepID=A0A085VYQ4_9BACT|nr:Ig domain-containing protein [Hyalangium minutum]KFE60567.1 hypothetical protein DB31_5906 [Hyalangium minutum]
MNARWLQLGAALGCAVGLVFACSFNPDLSRFEPCAEDGSCPTGFTCLAEKHLCLPDCSEESRCLPPEPPDAGTDAGPEEDGGVDGGTDGGVDGGSDGGTDAGVDAGPPFSLLTQKLALAVENTPYSVELQAEGGTPPYMFRATQPLPQGLALNEGTLSGQLNTPGTSPVKVEASDSADPPARVNAEYSLRVRPQLLIAGPMTLVEGYTGNFYTEKVSAIGGIPPYAFTYVSGNLPSTLPLGLDGTVQGAPNTTGNYSFRVRVTDSDPEEPQTAEEQLEATITSAPLLGTVISTKSVPAARKGTPYQYALRLMPSSALTWSLKAGTLPPGIGLNTQTGLLSGTPSATAGTSYTFTILVSDGLLTNLEKSFTMRVY